MAHIQQQEYCKSIQEKFPEFFNNKFVLDIGSLDINGNNQQYFTDCNYIGVDIAYGRNVDIVSKGHELGFPDNTFDVIISTECFEHDQYYVDTIKNIYRMLRPGGLFVFTCATTGRPEHGTRRTTPEDAPLLQTDIEWSDYYKNLTENDIREILDIESSFSLFSFSINVIANDLYFYGFKQGIYNRREDYSFLINEKLSQKSNFIQLFIEEERGFLEENSLKFFILQNKKIQRFEFDLKSFHKIKNLRLDPLNDSCVINISQIYVVLNDNSTINLKQNIKFNECLCNDNDLFFHSLDPQIYFENINFDALIIKSFVIELIYNNVRKNALYASVNQLIQNKKELNINIQTKDLRIQNLNKELQSKDLMIQNLEKELDIQKEAFQEKLLDIEILKEKIKFKHLDF